MNQGHPVLWCCSGQACKYACLIFRTCVRSFNFVWPRWRKNTVHMLSWPLSIWHCCQNMFRLACVFVKSEGARSREVHNIHLLRAIEEYQASNLAIQPIRISEKTAERDSGSFHLLLKQNMSRYTDSSRPSDASEAFSITKVGDCWWNLKAKWLPSLRRSKREQISSDPAGAKKCQ